MQRIVRAGLVMTALWPTETVAGELPEGAQRTLGGRLHDLGTLAILAGLLVALRLDAPGIGQRGFILVGLAWHGRSSHRAWRAH